MITDSAKQLFIGVDGGGTKTHMVLANGNGELIGFSESLCTNWEIESYNFDNWLKLFDCIAGKTIEVAVFTVSGWDFEEGQTQTRNNIEQALREQNISIVHKVYKNDVYSLFKSGITDSEDGIALASGTGTVALAIDGKNHFQTSAYGYIAGEWGAGIDIAEYALHLACSSLMSREDDYPILINHAFTYFGANDLESLIKKLVSPEYKSMKPGYFLANIYEAYHAGCEGARKVLERAASEFAHTVWSMVRKMENKTAPIVFGGGTFKNFGLPPMLKQRLFELTNYHHELRILKSDPVYGSIYWALELGGKPLDKVKKEIAIESIV